MAVRIAHEALKAIDELIQKDQGARFRQLLGQVIPHIGDAFRSEEESFRSHLGASIIGGECGRAIWYSWRWITKSKFPGRILRLFNRGHLEEARFIAMLLLIGAQVYQQDEKGKQFRISFADGHGGGSGDGIGINVPGFQSGQSGLLEFKTHGEKSFIELAGKLDDWRKHVENPQRYPFTGKGVRDAKFEHYVQMNVYMRKMGIPVALYGAVNKNTDDLYLELIILDFAIADQFIARAENLVASQNPPDRLNESPGFWKCRFCDHRQTCHRLPGAVIERNCRTCIFSQPGKEGQWVCTKFDNFISIETQRVGCASYEKHPKI